MDEGFGLLVPLLLFLQFFVRLAKENLKGKTKIYFDQPQLSLNMFQIFTLKEIVQTLYKNQDLEGLKSLLEIKKNIFLTKMYLLDRSLFLS